MVKHSKRNRRRLHQSGLGGGFTVVHRVPRTARQLPRGPRLTPALEFRLRCVEEARRAGVTAAARTFGRSRATIYRWLRRYDATDLTTLAPRSRRPKRVRRATWTGAQEQAVLTLREAHPRFGKEKLRHLLIQQGIRLSASMIGRILASARRRNLLIEPKAVRVRHPRPQRPYAIRLPKTKRLPTRPGELIQLDTMHLRPEPGIERRQFTAIDVVSRCAVLGVRSTASATTAKDFLDELLARMPVPVQGIQVDGGSEFMAGFETACQHRGIALYVLPPRSPKLNGRVERRNGTARREFWECYPGDLDLPTVQAALRQWERQYNTERPHQALGYRTPQQHLASSCLTCPEPAQEIDKSRTSTAQFAWIRGLVTRAPGLSRATCSGSRPIFLLPA
jgi:putative transposase